MEKSVEKSSKLFLENSALKIYNFLDKNHYGNMVNCAIEYEMNEGEYTGKISYELVIYNCKNVEDIIDYCEVTLEAEFSIMKKVDVFKYTDSIPMEETDNCYLFIFEK